MTRPKPNRAKRVPPTPHVSVPADVSNANGWERRVAHVGHRVALRTIGALRPALGPRVSAAFGILMYHRIASLTAGVPAPTYNVTPEQFRAQLEGLVARGYQAWPLRKVIEESGAGRNIPRNVFVVTFDDGYQNNYLNAWPVLKELKIPATFFLATAYLDSHEPFPFDDWSAAGSPQVPAESWRPLTTDQCREILDHGLVDLATHTHTHADFRDRPDALRADLLTSLDVMRDRFGLSTTTFAFPYGTRRQGFCSPALIQAARDAGVLCSLTTENELVAFGSDPFGWGRFSVAASDTAMTLAARLDGWYSLASIAWRKLRSPLIRSRDAMRVPASEAADPLPSARLCESALTGKRGT